MKKAKKPKINKGTSVGVLLSLLIHVVLFLLAGMLVVFTVVRQKEIEFEPPKTVERPKMKLKKPKVKIKKSSRPKSTSKIATTIRKSTMPDISLPGLGGLGDGLADGFGDGFDMMPDLEEVTIFGGGQSIGNDFVGTFYDIKRNRMGGNLPIPGRAGFVDIMYSFMKKGFDTSVLRKYYQSPKKLYTTIFAMPPDLSLMAPQAFGEPDCIGYFWLVHYKGKLVYHEDITFRFWGAGDDVLAVRVNGEYVLVSVAWSRDGAPVLKEVWEGNHSPDSGKYALGNQKAAVGDWITLKAGEPLDMEVVMAEIPGGNFQSILCVEVEGVDYPRNPLLNGPTLPVFKTEKPSLDLVEKIHWGLYEGDATITTGPVFRDFKVVPERSTVADLPENKVEGVVREIIEEDRMHTWDIDGEPLRAEFIMAVGDKVVLQNERGKQIKLPLTVFNVEDRNYIELNMPPVFNIDFSKRSVQIKPPEQPPNTWYRPIQLFDYEFGVKLKQTSPGIYSHELKIEYFAVGEEVDGDNYVLLDRKSSIFEPMDSKTRSYEFYGDRVRLKTQAILPWASMRGTKYSGYLITITDTRGRIIQHAESNKFLFENLENLKKLSVGRHFDRECRHVGPPRPGKDNRPQGW